MYEAEAPAMELWLQLADARQAAALTHEDLARRLGVSVARLARVEKRVYESCTLNPLRR